MKRDKLDRWRTSETAVASLEVGVPFWISLTPRERCKLPRNEVLAFYMRHGDDRREFRNFVRNLADRKYVPTGRAGVLADRYAEVAQRHRFDRDSPAYRLAVLRGWVLRHGAAHGVVCLEGI